MVETNAVDSKKKWTRKRWKQLGCMQVFGGYFL